MRRLALLEPGGLSEAAGRQNSDASGVGFDSREALLAFVRTAGRLDSGDWLSDWVVFDAVSFRIQQPIQVFQAGAPVQLASQVLRLVIV